MAEPRRRRHRRQRGSSTRFLHLLARCSRGPVGSVSKNNIVILLAMLLTQIAMASMRTAGHQIIGGRLDEWILRALYGR